MNDGWDVERVRAVRMEFGGGFDIKGGLLRQRRDRRGCDESSGVMSSVNGAAIMASRGSPQVP